MHMFTEFKHIMKKGDEILLSNNYRLFNVPIVDLPNNIELHTAQLP
jgi:hypothetical protein